MSNIRSLDDLKRYKCPKIEIVEVDVAKILPELKYVAELPLDHEEFKSEYDKKLLNENIIKIKTFKTDSLLPLRITHRGLSYPSYGNSVDYQVAYNSANLLKIDLIYGFNVLKQNDERFYTPIITNRNSLYFRYDIDDPKPRWKRVQDVGIWNKWMEEIEAFKKLSTASIVRGYFEGMETLENLEQFRLHNETAIQKIKDFLVYKNVLNELSEPHFELLMSSIDRVAPNLKSNEETQVFASRKHLLRIGYHVKDGTAYPSLQHFYDLSQKAKSPRKKEILEKIEEGVLKYSKTAQKDFVEVDDPNLGKYIPK